MRAGSGWDFYKLSLRFYLWRCSVFRSPLVYVRAGWGVKCGKGTSSLLPAGKAAAAWAEGPGGEGTCSQKMRISLFVTWSEAPDKQGTWGLQQETRDLGSGQWDIKGEPMRT
jgi:hypothetical protein